MADEHLQRLLDEREIERLVATYCHLVDFGDAPGIADLFTTDGQWLSEEVQMIGQEAIRAGFTRRQSVTRRQSRHVCANLVVDVEGATARGLCYLINYRHDSPTGVAEQPAPADLPKYVGEYRDRFERTPDGWRFSERRFDLAFLRPTSR